MWDAIQQLILERDAAETATAKRLVSWAEEGGVPVVLEDAERTGGRSAPDLGIQQSKRSIRVVRYRGGAVLKPCTGRTDSLLCCNLHVVTQTVGCPLDCSYCILQSYQNRIQITVQADPSDLLSQLSKELAHESHRLFRICTGQVADSLALEPRVGFAVEAICRFAELPNAVLELKTKTDQVEFLLGLPHGGRTIVSWSLSPSHLVQTEEHGAVGLERRLAAAARAAEAGYLLAFHLDPMITPDGDPGPHLELIEQLVGAVPRDRVAYVSMGTVRFQPAMRRTVSTRFPRSRITHAELLPDVDGKLRLLAPQRVELYRAVARQVRELLPKTFVYLCMEPRRIWRRALGDTYEHRGEVELAMAQSLHRRFGLAPCEPRIEHYTED